ncbi:hypothetical protein EGY25_08710 [Brevundimonas intermedia]|uniref:Uncharacterized protein n=1 Tax=Brevundimonas intermedia TaxID=74315 RepID=A0A4Y9RV65_9CAUL|nr:hypothetical protein [Brevundimonas intermedia]TFW12121.1 hypothetical protein EGY25_08710 [Brevundimonas intermedia]
MALKVESGNVALTGDSERLAEKAASELEGREHTQILEHRDRFSEISYGIMQAWVGFLIVLTLAQFSLKPLGMGLETPEFIAVITTTTASVFGFGLLVGNFLFPRGGSERRRK